MDSLPGGDPKDAIKKIADDLKEKAKSAGLGGADAFVDKLEDIKDAAAKGPGDVLDKITGAFDEFKKKIDNAIANPGSLAPGGGAMAACASYYGNAVVSKLKVVADEANELLQAIMKVAADLAEAFKSLAATMGKAMTGITSTVKGLSSLPQKVMKIADDAKDPKDIGQVDTGPMKKSLDTSGLGGPLDELVGLKSLLGPTIEMAKEGLAKLGAFIEGLADRLRAAFSAPPPLCCIGAPPMLADMLKQVEALQGIEFGPFVDKLGDTSDTIKNLNVETVKSPVEKFATEAKENVDNLDKVVQGAKMAGSVPSVPGVGKMF